MSQITTTNLRLDENELQGFRMAAASAGVSFNTFALQALRSESTRQTYQMKTDTSEVAKEWTLRDLPMLAKLPKAKGQQLTKLDEELYDI